MFCPNLAWSWERKKQPTNSHVSSPTNVTSSSTLKTRPCNTSGKHSRKKKNKQNKNKTNKQTKSLIHSTSLRAATMATGLSPEMRRRSRKTRRLTRRTRWQEKLLYLTLEEKTISDLIEVLKKPHYDSTKGK